MLSRAVIGVAHLEGRPQERVENPFERRARGIVQHLRQKPAAAFVHLRGAAGETLLQVFWVVNAPFFINLLLTAWEFRRAAKATDPSDSASSSPPSSPTGTTPSG